jgi:SAM-dependent methyltransferase
VFLRSVYRELSGKEPYRLREDFCGAHALARAWVNLGDRMCATGVDIDQESLAYGIARQGEELTAAQRSRLTVIQGNVLTSRLPKAQLVCAFNFSYFCFHDRRTLVQYFQRVKRSLEPGGIFVVDAFGGPDTHEPSVDRRKLPGVRYFFEQEFFDPISHRTRFHIHLQPHGQRIRKRIFSYDWRMWTMPEIREAMEDAGFSQVVVYWEGTGRDGRGSGRYHRRDRGESCRVWTAYIVGL